jgi:FkbM family methyltransferase
MPLSRAQLLRAVGKLPGASHALRWLASRYAEGSVVTIMSGHARGLKWRRSHRYVNGFWVGQHELELQDALARLVRPGDVFFDLGANAGFFSMIGARLVGAGGRCVAVDPDPANCQSMGWQRALNEFGGRWEIVRKAVDDSVGTRKFFAAAPGSDTGRLVADGEVAASHEVEATTIDALAREHGAPAVIKVDVEGAEVRALRGAAETLAKRRAAWVLELHSPELADEARRILAAAGYRFTTLAGATIADGQPLGYHAIALPAEPGPA